MQSPAEPAGLSLPGRSGSGAAGRRGPTRPVQWAREQAPLILLVALVIAGSLLSDVFFTSRNLLNILWAVSVLGIVALGQTLLLITARFDMSVAGVVGLAGIVTVLAQIAGWGLGASLLFGVASGALVGLCNGAIVLATAANPFLVTLGTNLLVYSLALTLTESRTFYATIPEFNLIGRGRLFGVIHYSVLIFLGIALILEFLLRRTVFGRTLFVVGLNETAGRLSGLRVNAAKLATFVLCSMLAAIAGIIMTARNNSTVASAGFGMEFDSIIAAVLGGTSLFGGRGSALRAVVGVAVLGVLNNLLVLLNVPIEMQQIAKGTVFLLVVWADSLLTRR